MAKLQEIKRANGSIVHSVNIPQEVIEFTGWTKGLELDLEAKECGVLITKR